MKNFFEWSDRQIGVAEQKQILTGIIAAIPKIKAFLLESIQLNINESSGGNVTSRAEKYILSNKVFVRWLSKYGELIKKDDSYAKSCGLEACAYYCTNDIVVKISEDHKEMDIANKIRGKLNIVPVVDAVEIEVGDDNSISYAIVMARLEVDILPVHVNEAAKILIETCYYLMDKVYENQNISSENIRRRLSLAYFSRNKDVDEKVLLCLGDMVRMVKLVYVKSGYLLGADWSTNNMGTTGSGKVQAFDYGRSIVHIDARIKAPDKKIKKLFLPAQANN